MGNENSKNIEDIKVIGPGITKLTIIYETVFMKAGLPHFEIEKKEIFSSKDEVMQIFDVLKKNPCKFIKEQYFCDDCQDGKKLSMFKKAILETKDVVEVI